jgi:hypothetical protein
VCAARGGVGATLIVGRDRPRVARALAPALRLGLRVRRLAGGVGRSARAARAVRRLHNMSFLRFWFYETALSGVEGEMWGRGRGVLRCTC